MFRFSFSVRAIDLKITNEELKVFLEDGRSISVPLEWFPKLRDAKVEDLNDWEFIGGGIGIHWKKLDEDISVRGLLEVE
ncbi:MAG: DUF2442 domain-containing protein [Brevinematia bacterium]